MKTKQEQFINLLDNVLWDLGFSLDYDMYEAWKKMPEGVNKEKQRAAMSVAGHLTMDLLRLISNEYKRIYKIKVPKKYRKCCVPCESRIQRWKDNNFEGGKYLYE